jgi:site-specific DNA-methyltransferase (adenine-specific)
MAIWNIVESELLEYLKAYDGPRFHAVLADPPYALISITKRFGKNGSAAAQKGNDGRYMRLSAGFMGSQWDSFRDYEHYQTWVSEWAELLIEKVLYPGAVCLFFGGTRTFHHLGVGLERGGFEIVDTMMWLTGQGFPKSHSISKGLDKAAGAERASTDELLPGHSETRQRTFGTGGEIYGGAKEAKAYKTIPATPDAETWDGYGTHLKPAWEPIYLCRAPRGNKTFAQLATEFGTGALNIDGTRIVHSEPIKPMDAQDGGNKVYGQAGRYEPTTELKASGRWPANFILVHAEDCVKVGEYTVEGRTINRFDQGMMPFGNADGEDYQSEQMPPETVERWACVQGCPVRMLDDQAGELSSGLMKARTARSPRPEHAVYSGIWEGNATNQDTYADAGGPSRFFYTAKASRSEKDKGLERFWWKRTDEGFERISLSEYEQLDKGERARGCIHPTVKPLDLLKYLSTLSLPPKQEGKFRRILIPFSGSGSEMLGAVQAGWDEVIGIEMEQNYVEMAEARLSANIGML